MAAVDFYFDFACPWTWLAATRLQEVITRTGSNIVWKPIDLEENKDLTDPRIRGIHTDEGRAWLEADLHAWADYCGLRFGPVSSWPASGRLAGLGALCAAAEDRAGPFVKRVFRAAWEQQVDITDPAALGALAGETGLDEAGFLAALEAPRTAELLAANAEELRSRGGFRSATMFVGERMFCGNSRMPLVEFALGQASDRQFVMPGSHG